MPFLPPAPYQAIINAADIPGGDALDSVIAAFATFQAVRNLARSSVLRIGPYVLEGYVYV